MDESWVGTVSVQVDGVVYQGTWKRMGDDRIVVRHGRNEASVKLQDGDVNEQAAALLAELVEHSRRR